MADVVLTSVQDIKTLARNLNDLAGSLRGGGSNIPGQIEMRTAEKVATEVRENIGTIPDLDGNLLGAGSASVIAFPLGDHWAVIWAGAQIAFLEYGTGATGFNTPYKGVMLGGYHPDPTKKRWAYRDPANPGGEPIISHGITPQAPMYNAAMVARASKLMRAEAIPILNEEVRRAVAIR